MTKNYCFLFDADGKEIQKNFCILFISKHTKDIINITFIHENLSFVKFLQPFLSVIAHEQLSLKMESLKLSLKMEWVPDVAKSKSCFNLRFVTFSCGLFSKISSIAITIVSCKGILVKRLQTYVTKVPMEEIIGRREKSSE